MQCDKCILCFDKGLQSRIPIYLVLPSLVDEGWYQLAAVLNFCVCNRPKKNWNSRQFILELSSRLNLYNPLVRQQSSNLSPSLSSCLLSGNHSWRLFQKTIEGFDCKINGQALWAALQHSLGGLDGRDQTQCVAKSSAVAADCVAATGSLEENVLAVLQYWLSSRFKRFLCFVDNRCQAATSHLFFHVKWKFRWNWRDVGDVVSSSAHCFAQSFDHSLVSESKYDIGTKPHNPNRIICKAADLNRRLASVREKGVSSDSNQTAQLLQMAERKS